jgi:hypothetical protein
MKKYFLRISALCATFLGGVLLVSVWLYGNYSQIPPRDAVRVGDARRESKKTDDLNRFNAETENYAVYSTILADFKVKQGEYLMVNDYTSQGLIAEQTDFAKEYPNLSQPMIDDFRAKMHTRRELENKFERPDEVRIFDEATSLPRGKANFWEGFYKLYPKAQGFITFSDIGYNAERTTALVSVAYGCGGLCGHGSFFVLSKSNGRWKIEREIDLWVS